MNGNGKLAMLKSLIVFRSGSVKGARMVKWLPCRHPHAKLVNEKY